MMHARIAALFVGTELLLGCAGGNITASPGGGAGNGGGGTAGTTGPIIDFDAAPPQPVTPVDPGSAPIPCDNPTA